MDINKIKITLLDIKYQDFLNCSSKFLTHKYELFQNCYISKCEDSRFKRMASKLDEKYLRIKKGYQNIGEWWDSYLKNVQGLEQALAQNGNKAMTEGDLLAYVYQNIESLNTFEEKISTLLSPSLIGDVSSVIKAFQGNMSALKMMSTSVLGANLGINAFNLGAVAGVSENQTEINRNSDMDQITNRAFGRSFNMDGTNANFSDDVGSVLNLQNITSPTNNSSLNPSFSEKEQRSLDANELNEQVLFQSMSGTSLAASAAAYSFRSALTSQKSADTKEQENSETLDTTSEHTSNKKQDVSGSNDTETVIDDSSLAGIVSQSFSGEDWESAFARNLESAKIMSKACDVTIKDLQAQQDELQQGLDSFLIGNGYALRTEFYMPGDTIDSVKALTPEEYEKRLLNSIDYDVPDSDPEIGYNVIKRQEKAKKKALEYAIKFNEAFEKRMGISYNDYLEQLQSIENDIATIKFSKYSFDQQIKMSPYLSIMYSEAFKEYKAGYDPLGEYELDKVGFFKKQNPIRYCEKLDEKFASINEDMVESILANSNLESYERFTLLSEDEKALYSFLYDNKGYKEAEKYLKAMEDTLNNRQGLKEAVDFINGISDVKVSVDYVSPTAQQDFLNALESVDVGDKWYSFFSTTGKGFGDGLQTFGEGFANIFSTEGMISTNQYAQMYILQGFSKDWFLTGTYEVSTSAGNMAPAIAFSAAATVAAGPAGLGLSAETAATVGSTMGYISTGFSVFGNAKNQALVNGNSLASSTLYATCSGVSEVALGKLLGNIGILNENAQFALKEILNEGIEEGLQEFVDAGLRTAFLNEEVEINQLIGDSGKSFLYGIIMSTITTSGQQAIRIVAKGKTHTINSSDAVELLELLNNCDEASQEQVVLDYLTNVENNGHAENIYTPIEVVEEISFKDKLKNFGTDVLNSLGETGAKIASGVVSLNEGLSEFKGKMWQNTKTNAVKALDTIFSVNNQISDFRTRIWNSTLSTGGKVVNGIQNVFIKVADITGSGFNNYMNFRSDVQNSVKDVVLDTVDSVIDSKVNEFEQVTTLLDTTKETVANLLQVDVVPEDSIGSTFDAFFEDVNTNVKEILHSRISLPKTFIGMFYSPFGVLSKLVYTPVKNNVEVSKTILEDGIYHITSLENAQKILESGYVKASNVLSSYGSKKSFFFAGFPNFENVAVNIPSFLEKTVAVKFDIDEADLDHFRYRSLADHAVAAMGDYVFDSAKASLVYLGLMNDNGKLVYKEIPEETYNSYHTDISTDFLGRRIVTLEKNLVAMAREGGNIIRNVENLLDIIHNGDVVMTAAKVAVGAKNVISSNLNDLGGRITSVTHDYQEKVSSIDQLGPTYEQLEGKRIFDLLNKAIEGKINEPIKALVDEYNNLLDSDGRLAELIRKANNGETVNIPQELMDSYLRLRKLEFSILHPGTMATTGEVQNVFMEQIKNSFDGVSSYVSGLVDKMHSVQVGETLKSNVISIFESLVSMRDDVVNFFGQLKTKAFHRDNDLYHFNTFGLKGNLKDFAQEVMTRGSLSSTLGKQLEKVFFDDNYIVGVHNLGSLVVDSNGRNIRGDKILQNGLILTGNSETRFTGDLSDNIRFYTNKNKKYSFALFLNDLFTSSYYKADGEGSAAIICIPKELEGNMDALVYYKDGQAILKPEYVMGYVNSNEGNLSDLNTLDSLSPSYQELLGIDTIMVDGKAYSVDVLEKLINNVDQAFNKLGNIDQNVDLFGKGFSPQEYVKAAQRLVDELVSKGINVSEEVFSKLNFLQKLYLPSIDSLNLSTTKRYTMDISDIDEAIRPFAEEYLETGFVSEKLGTQLEQWYFDEDTVIGFHALGETLFDSNGRNIMGDAALRNGVILSGNTETGVTGNLTDNIVLETDPSKFNFLFFLRNLCATSTYKAHGEGGAVIVQIPKKLLNNPDALVHEVDGQLYLKPEYVRGYVNSSNYTLSELITVDSLPDSGQETIVEQSLKLPSYTDVLNNNSFKVSFALNSTGDTLSILSLESILKDNNVFEMFKKLDSAKDKFEGFSKNEVIVAISELKNALEKAKYKFSSIEEQRYQEIIGMFDINLQKLLGKKRIQVKNSLGKVANISVKFIEDLLLDESKFQNYIKDSSISDIKKEEVIFAAEWLYENIAYKDIPLLSSMKNELVFFHTTFQDMINKSKKFFEKLKVYGADQDAIHGVLRGSNKEFYKSLFIKVKEMFKGINDTETYKFLNGMNVDGICGYATLANEIFVLFQNNAQLFKEKFQYEMYTESGELSAAGLLLDLYLFINKNNENLIRKIDGEWNAIGVDKSGKHPINSRSRDTTILNQFLKLYGINYNMNSHFIYNNIDFKYHTVSDQQIDLLRNEVIYHIKNGNAISLGVFPYVDSPNNGLTFYSTSGYENVNTNNWNETGGASKIYNGGHSIYVTGISDTGDLIVSSWGKEYIVKWSELATECAFEITATKYKPINK